MSDEDAKSAGKELFERTRDDPLWSYRGRAIDAYSKLEQALCRVMQHMIGTSANKAGIIFFRIASASARSLIIERLIQDNYGTRFNLFWNSFFKALRVIDAERNEIAHWSSIYDVATNKMLLCPPNIWGFDQNTPSKNVEELQEFSAKCEIYANLAHNFYQTLNPQQQALMSKEQLASLLQIFQQPIIYPLPANHPLDPNA